MNLYIVILHYGIDTAITKQFVAQLKQYSDQFSQLVLVNNDTRVTVIVEQLGLAKEKIHYIASPENLGFAKGVNVGIRYALAKNASHILLVNNDTKIPENLFSSLANALGEKDAGIVGPVIKFNKKGETVYDLGGYVQYLMGRTFHNERASVMARKPFPADYVSGCCVLVRRDVFERVGFFDEQFFLYYEDVDFALRAREKGFLSYVVPDVILTHELSATIGKLTELAIYNQTKSGLLFGKKYCRVVLLNRIFILLQSLKIYLKNREAGKIAFKAFFETIRSTKISGRK